MILTNNKTIASEASTHYYRMDGSPCYTVIGANGKERPVTIREARSMSLVPSVTQVLKVIANPGLDVWKRQQLLLAAATLPKLEGETLEEWMARVETDSKEHGKQAAELGTSIHASLEQAYDGAIINKDHAIAVSSTMCAISDRFGKWTKWSAEKSFADEHWLYGGKIDLSSTDIVIDFKTSAFDSTKKEREFGYLEHQIQIAAYAAAIGCTRGVNVYVSTTVPGLVHIKEWTESEMADGFEMFRAALKFWQIKNKYKTEES
jgi:hypothetical protein